MKYTKKLEERQKWQKKQKIFEGMKIDLKIYNFEANKSI